MGTSNGPPRHRERGNEARHSEQQNMEEDQKGHTERRRHPPDVRGRRRGEIETTKTNRKHDLGEFAWKKVRRV